MHTFDLERVEWGSLASGTRVLSSDLDDGDADPDDVGSFEGDSDEDSDSEEW